MNQLQPIAQSAQGLFAQVLLVLQRLLLPARLDQVLLLIVLVAAAQLTKRFGGPVFYAWMKGLEGRPKWQLRTLILLHKRLAILSFVVLSWTAVAVLTQISPFPSRRYVVTIAATLATAWFVVGLAGRAIRNRFLRRLVTWGAWAYVTLHFLGLIEPTANFLDEFAITLGGFRLSALAVLKALVVTGILFTGARLLSQTATKRIGENEDISPSMRVLAVKFLQIVLYGSAFFIGLKAVGFDLTGIAVFSGAIGVGLGFGLQKVVSNLVSGVIILLDKSVKPGDVISLGETFGWINALGARYVSVVTRDGKEYLIPNEDLITGQVVNWSHSNDFVRLDVFFGTAYADDPHKVRQIAVEACATVKRVLRTRAPVCHVVGFGDSSVDYILRFWISDPTEGLTNIRGAVYLALWDAFKANDISFPFPQREVRLLSHDAHDRAPPLPGD
ncbi:mechanosensitive ion channel family protein [Solirhodobacter olei]|uniref:mechanosensitive ion channel family protein n=1 Tax=Solirhodobacter olei TaxID=2493082 RepID=UPI000FDA9B26|nr:mechanosensitive ion channel domain-containing protein [Solirhodobacter olei]